MKKNSLISASGVLLATALTVLSVAPAHAADEVPAPAATSAPAEATPNEAVIPEEPQAAEPAPEPTAEPAPEQPAPAPEPAPEPEPTVEPETPAAPAEETPVAPAPEQETPAEQPTEQPAPEETPAETPAEPEEETPAALNTKVTIEHVGIDSVTIRVAPATEQDLAERYSVIINSPGYESVLNLNDPGTVSFDNLKPFTEYSVTVRAWAAGETTPSITTSSFRTSDVAPGRPVIIGSTVGNGTVSITYKADDEGGGVEYFTAVIRSVNGDLELSQESRFEGTFNFYGLPAGLYSYVLEARGPGGVAGVENSFFVIPEAPQAPNVTTNFITSSSVTLKINPVIANPIPDLDGTVSVAKVAYTITFTNGSEEIVKTLEDNLPTQVREYTVAALKPNTKYDISVVASNVAGASPATKLSATTVEEKPVEATAPEQEWLVDEYRGDVEVPAEAVRGESVTINVGKAFAGQIVNGWLFSEPTALGQALVAADGTATFSIPSSVPAGAHRLAVTDQLDSLVGWGNIEVAAAAVTPPADGGDDNGSDNGAGNGNSGNNGGTPVDNNSGLVNTGGNAPAAINTGANTDDVTGDDREVVAQTVTDKQLARTGGSAPLGLAILGALMFAGGALLVAMRRKSVEA